MNTQKTFLTLGAVLFSAAALAQSFSIDSFTMAAGGPSSGGLFALSGTIGQPDVGAMSGGNYSLAGGFWRAIPTPPPAPTVIELSVNGGLVYLRFNGIPGRTYDIERARFVTGPWPPTIPSLVSITMPIGGSYSFVDTSALPGVSQFFYRTRLRQQP
jgi:hypothetical protein